MNIHIRNMVCNRCIAAVEQVFAELELKGVAVSMGVVELKEEQLSADKKAQLKAKLTALGFELIDDKKSKLIESIKNIIIKKIHHEELSEQKLTWSDIISEALHYEYKYLSRLFSSVEGITIEQYIILQKTEKVKELMVYDEFTLSEIAWKLGYSSVAHLSSQFKKVTGMPPGEFKKLGVQRRKPLDKV